jgi:hypothetical protein
MHAALQYGPKYMMREYINIIETANQIHLEASYDVANDIVREYALSLERRRYAIYNEVYSDSPSGAGLWIGGYRRDGFTFKIAKNLVNPLVIEMSKHGWFLAKQTESKYGSVKDEGGQQTLCFFDFLPMKGKAEVVPETVFHISSRANRKSIEKNGIKPFNGGTDHIVTENARIYVVLDVMDIDGIAYDINKLRGWRKMDVWLIKSNNCIDEWYEDLELSGSAAWTPHAIPRNTIEFYEEINI